MNTQHDTPDDLATAAMMNGRIAVALTPLTAPAEGLSRLRSRLGARVAASAARHRGLTTLRNGDAQWQEVANGVRAWVLHDNGASRSTLIEFDPGASMAAHRHTAHEECIVLRGSLDAGGCLVRVNDYHVAPAGSRHAGLSSPEGGMAYVRGTSVGKMRDMLREYFAGWLPGTGPAPYTIPAHSGEWRDWVQGAAIKPLFSADGEASVLLRLDAGARVTLPPATAGRECLLLTGEVFVGDILVRQGEYQVAQVAQVAQVGQVEEGAEVSELYSDTGALLFVHGKAGGLCPA